MLSSTSNDVTGGKRILLLSTNEYDCLTVLKCLGVSKRGHRILLYGNLPQENNWLRTVYGVEEVIPRITDYHVADSALLDEVLSICSERKIEVLLPTGFCSLKYLSYYRKQLAKRVLMAPVPDYASIAQLDDKSLFYTFCLDHDVPHPKSATDPAQVAADPQAWTDFPALVKPSVAAASRGIMLVRDRAELLDALKQFNSDTPVLVQEYLEGYDIDFNGYVFEGELLAYTIHMVKEFRLTGRTLKFNAFVEDPEVSRLARQIVSSSNYSGPINMDFRYQAGSNKLYAIEVNPRFWASTHHSLIEGINFVEVAIDAASGSVAPIPYRPADRAWIPLTKLVNKQLLKTLPFDLRALLTLGLRCSPVEYAVVLKQLRASLLFKIEKLDGRLRSFLRYKGFKALWLLVLKNLTKNILSLEKVYVLAKSECNTRTEPSIKVNIGMAGKADIDMVEPLSYGNVKKRVADGQKCYVAKYGDDLCGYLWASKGCFYPGDSKYYFDLRANEGYIYDVRTLEEFKGLKIGPGILECAAQDFSSCCEKLYAVVISDNTASLKMMERAGFVIESQMKIITLFNRTISKEFQAYTGR